MEPKKNPKSDLRKKSMLFFQIGLILILFLTWRAIEMKTYPEEIDIGQVSVDDLLDEDVPITEIQNTPPPPPPAPEVIEVVEDEVEVEETIIESTETTQEEIVEVEEVEEVVEEEIADVPFAVIENVPIFPGCEGQSNNAARKACMSEKVDKFVKRKFDQELGGELGLSGIQRIYVAFKIDNKGNITNVRARAPHPRLAKEAENVVKALPKMTPGKQRGKPVGVLYSLPIVFQVLD